LMNFFLQERDCAGQSFLVVLEALQYTINVFCSRSSG
jgi:hypothetical protein